ncbi:DUF2087 domain-containing protein [Bartonella kosoyi]|uniref:DUF2087 domain-containing protein n=1 Tax=Bartonella kosoyi TaxID=2133959 RepID=A0A5B9CYA6_9HYPH|nr:DUF2087 domain-containing protein [Bartonella kosoyi]
MRPDFQKKKIYSETEISKICKLFTVDFARLRRPLVERGFLQRHGENISACSQKKLNDG